MPKGISNWMYRDVVAFLIDHGFEFKGERKGSHEAWIHTETQAVVDINFHAHKSFPPRTLETMIRQSKIKKKEWRRWAGQ